MFSEQELFIQRNLVDGTGEKRMTRLIELIGRHLITLYNRGDQKSVSEYVKPRTSPLYNNHIIVNIST